MTRFAFKDFDGLTPVFDAKKVTKPFVLDGRNFAMMADGPASIFGRRLIGCSVFRHPEAIQSFRVLAKSEAFYMTREGIFHFDSATWRMEPIFLIAAPGSPPDPEPWTSALVGGKQYFARRDVGLVQYDGATNTWALLTGGSIPENIVSCTQSGGRLIVLAEGVVAWSVIDDGTDFTPSTTTGAGFQSLSIINSTCTCSPYKVLEYAAGFIVYTSEGMVRFELVQSVIPFRFKVLSRKHIPVNPYCVIEVGQYEHVMLSKAGFFSTTGAIPEPWQVDMGQYLHERIVPVLDVDVPAVIRLDTDFDRQTFMVSFSNEQFPGTYTKAFVLYLPSQKWGSFDRNHTGLIDVHIDEAPNAGFHWGYCDTEGTLWEFYSGANDIKQRPPEESIWLYNFRPAIEYRARYEVHSGITYAYMPTFGHLHTTDESKMREIGLPGQYNLRFENQTARSPVLLDTPESTAVDGSPAYMQTRGKMRANMVELVLAKEPPYLADLNAWLEVGLFRAGEDMDLSELTLLHELAISSKEVALATVFEDYINDYIDIDESLITEDYAAVSPDEFEDWGFGDAATSRFTTMIRASLDGYKTWLAGTNTPIETDPLIPYLVNGRTQFFPANQTGLYHHIKIYTEEAGDQFDLKIAEINMEPAGFLY